MPDLKPLRIPYAVILLLLALAIFSAFRETRSAGLKSTRQVQWQLDTTLNGVQFLHADMTCNGKQVVLLKFNNQNTYPVKISWKESVTDKKNRRHESAAGMKEIRINPGETAASGCGEIQNKQLLVRPEQSVLTHAIRITKFQFRDLIVTKA